jgi:hypothetical protein
VNEKQIIEGALERLCKRSAQVLYKQKKWIGWVQERQEGDPQEAESRRIKQQAQLFRRHQKELEKRQRELREKESKKLQDAYLEEAYSQRLSEMSDEAQEEWDPIQDLFEDERETFVDLIKLFLMLEDEEESAEGNGEQVENGAPSENAPALSKSAKKRAKKERAAEKKASSGPSEDPDARGPDTIEMESKSQLRKRLQEGVEYSRAKGYHVVGTLERPVELHQKAAAIPDDEIDTLLEEIAEVKTLLFCRLLLSHATLLPIALKVNSVEEFLESPEVTSANMRDLCLKLERPALQDVRDACADFARAKTGENGEDVESDEEDDETEREHIDEDDETRRIPEKYRWQLGRGDETMPKVFKTKREEAIQKQRQRRREKKLMGEPRDTRAVDFGEIDNGNKQDKKIRIKVCGRYISNYPSEKALPRGGWYHFCLIAKDSDLNDAIELCRNWEEFFELNTLCMYHYFPAAKWMIWVGDEQRLQLLRLVSSPVGKFRLMSTDRLRDLYLISRVTEPIS